MSRAGRLLLLSKLLGTAASLPVMLVWLGCQGAEGRLSSTPPTSNAITLQVSQAERSLTLNTGGQGTHRGLVRFEAREMGRSRTDTLHLYNSSSQALRLETVRTDCGCLVVQQADTLLPGVYTPLPFELSCRRRGDLERELELWFYDFGRPVRVVLATVCRVKG